MMFNCTKKQVTFSCNAHLMFTPVGIKSWPGWHNKGNIGLMSVIHNGLIFNSIAAYGGLLTYCSWVKFSAQLAQLILYWIVRFWRIHLNNTVWMFCYTMLYQGVKGVKIQNQPWQLILSFGWWLLVL